VSVFAGLADTLSTAMATRKKPKNGLGGKKAASFIAVASGTSLSEVLYRAHKGLQTKGKLYEQEATFEIG
jgi:hypothetical protein